MPRLRTQQMNCQSEAAPGCNVLAPARADMEVCHGRTEAGGLVICMWPEAVLLSLLCCSWRSSCRFIHTPLQSMAPWPCF